MIQLLVLFIALLIAWLLFKMMNREPTIEEARTIGLQKAREHLENPILLEDYTEASRLPREELDSLIEQGKIPAYYWRQYTYVENRELIVVKK